MFYTLHIYPEQQMLLKHKNIAQEPPEAPVPYDFSLQ